jgi:peptidyl-prolyl cis-trans isomerase D
MISWIQRSFQQHFRIIFGTLLAVTIVSFVATIGAGTGIGRPDRTVVERDFFGYNLASQADVGRMEQDAALSLELHGVGQNLERDQLQKYAEVRVAALHLADDLHLPTSSPTEVQNSIRTLGAFTGANGQFDVTLYDGFRNNPRFDPADVLRVLGDDVRVGKVQALIGGPGYVLPNDVAQMLQQSDTAWTIGTAVIDYASFKPSITPAAADLAKFYQDNQFRYQIPARIVATYVDFPAARYTGSIAVTDAEVRALYDANPARFPKPVAPAALAAKAPTVSKADPAADFAAVRPQVEAALKLDRARSRAAHDASDLAYALYQSKATNGPALAAFLAARQVTEKPLAPFAADTGPAELGNGPDVADAVSKLSADQFFSEAVTTPNGAAIMLWKSVQPPRQPLLPEVQAKVLADYVESQKRERFAQLGREVRSELAVDLKSGLPFERAAAAVAATHRIKIDAKLLAPFTLRDRPKDLNETAAGALEHLDQGQISEMVATGDQGVLVYAQVKKSPELNPANPRFVEMRARLASYMAQASAGEYLDQMVAQEIKRTEPVAAK